MSSIYIDPDIDLIALRFKVEVLIVASFKHQHQSFCGNKPSNNQYFGTQRQSRMHRLVNATAKMRDFVFIFLKKDITESETVLFSLCLEIPTITQIADSRKN